MGRRVSREEKLDRAIAYYRGLVDALPRPAESLSEAPDSKLQVILRKAGYERISPRFLAILAQHLSTAGLGTFPDLSDPAIDRDTRIYFYDLQHPIPNLQPPRVLFLSEDELERFLVDNFKAMQFFKERALHLRRTQAPLPNRTRVDLLAEDEATGELVGIELKAREPDDRLVAQVGKYVEGLLQLANDEHRPGARLLIVTGQPDAGIQRQVHANAAAAGAKVEWVLYRLQVKMTNVDHT